MPVRKSSEDRELTVTRATQQVRTRVSRLLPGVMTHVESRTAYDEKADRAVVVTIVTLPKLTYGALDLRIALGSLPKVRRVVADPERFTIVRDR